MLESIFQKIEVNQDANIQELRDFCACRSVKGDEEGLRASSAFVRRKLASLGFEIREKQCEGRPPVFYAFRAGRKPVTILAYNHYDVVPEGTLESWANPPFDPQIREERLWGRGVSDDKGALLSRLQAAEAILACEGELPCNTAFLFEGEEETGSTTLRTLSEAKDAFLKEAVQADLCLWENGRTLPDGSPEAAFGVRETLMVTLRAKTMNCEEHGRMSSELPNAAWRLVWALNSLKNAEDEVLVDGFYEDVLTPTEEDLRVVADYPYDEEGTLQRKEIKAFVGGRRGAALKKRIFLEPSLNLAGLEAGMPWKGPRNIVPHEASATVSVILVPDQKADDILRKIEAHFKKHGFEDIEVSGAAEGYPVRTPLESEWTQVLKRAAERVYAKPLTPSITQLGSGPAYLLREVNPGLPIIAACGVASLKSGHHSPKESIALADYQNGIKFMASLLYEAENRY